MLGAPYGALPVEPWAFGAPFPLDPFQEDVANAQEGVVLVTAAAGSGKTRVAVERTLRFMRNRVVPETILMLAYNTDAAETIRVRLKQQCPVGGGRVQTFTFHSWCYRLLRTWFPQELRFQPNRIIDTDRGPPKAKIAREVLRGLKMKEDPVYDYLRFVDLGAELLLDVRTETAPVSAQAFFGLSEADAETWVTFARAYREAKARLGHIDFSDMLLEVGLWIELAPEAPHVQALSRIYRHVVVDECQDMSPARFTVASHLARGAASALYCGDARQGINGFAGAKLDILLRMYHNEEVKKLVLPVNYRSSRRIVARSNEIATGQEWNLGGDTWFHDAALEGEPVQVHELFPEDEGPEIVADIQRRHAAGRPWRAPSGGPSYLVMARTNAVLFRLECAFIARGVPARISGAPGGLWGSQLGKRMLAYLRGAEGIVDFGLLDVSNRPKRFAKREAVVTALKDTAPEAGRALHGQLQMSLDPGTQRLGRDLVQLAGLDWPKRCAAVHELLRKALVAGGNGALGGLGGSREDDEEAALRVVHDLAVQLGSLEGIEAYRRAQAKAEGSEETVVLSTIHRMKGGEAPVCYLASCCKDILPHKKADDWGEERRLFYVATTRAAEALIVTTGGPPSVFLTECWGFEPRARVKARAAAEAVAATPRPTVTTRRRAAPRDPTKPRT